MRYKYDSEKRERIITVELIADRQPWQKNLSRIPHNKKVKIRIDYGEIDLGRKVKSFGGAWNRTEKVWEIEYRIVRELGLEDRIVRDIRTK